MFGFGKAFGVLGVGFALVASSAQADTSIRFGSHISPKALEISAGVAPFLDAVEDETGGAITFQRFLGGALGRSPAQQYELMQSSIFDATLLLPSYNASQFPDFGLFALPYLFENAEEGSVAAWRMYERGLLDVPDDIHVVTVFINGNSSIHTTDKISSAEDLKGLRIRTAGPDEAAVIEAVGAVPVGLGIGEIAESMSRGVVDGALSGWAPMAAFRFDELSHGHLVEPYGSRAFILAIRKDIYENLSDEEREVVDSNGGEKLARAVGAANDKAQAAMMAKASEDETISVVEISPEDREGRAELFAPIIAKWAEESPKNAGNLEAVNAILAELRAQ